MIYCLLSSGPLCSSTRAFLSIKCVTFSHSRQCGITNWLLTKNEISFSIYICKHQMEIFQLNFYKIFIILYGIQQTQMAQILCRTLPFKLNRNEETLTELNANILQSFICFCFSCKNNIRLILYGFYYFNKKKSLWCLTKVSID